MIVLTFYTFLRYYSSVSSFILQLAISSLVSLLHFIDSALVIHDMSLVNGVIILKLTCNGEWSHVVILVDILNPFRSIPVVRTVLQPSHVSITIVATGCFISISMCAQSACWVWDRYAANGVVAVVNLAARGKHLMVKFPMWDCVQMISLPIRHGHGLCGKSKGECIVLKGFIKLNRFSDNK